VEITALFIFLFVLSLILGHVGGYLLVRFTRSRGLNDFVALGTSCAALFFLGIADVILRRWYIHPAGFGVLMGTIMFLAEKQKKKES
jgi:uncharacterized protein YneF (UPF0154 family)